MTSDPPAATATMPLWVTLRGAPVRVVAEWAAWTALAVGAGATAGGLVGAGGVVVGILTLGWWLARHRSTPLDVARRYHLDDDEILAVGPWRRVQRLTWAQVEQVTQERHALVLAGAGRTVPLPLPALLATTAWGPVLARVVPTLAAALWERLDGGAVRLVPHADPPAASLVWWAWVPGALAALASGQPIALVVAAGLSIGERLAAWLAGRARACVLQPAGIDVRGRQGRLFVPWAHALVTPATDGLGVSVPGRDPGVVSTALPSFWAAAAVIELRAQLGGHYAADVNFRVRFENGGIAVVGEVESLH